MIEILLLLVGFIVLVKSANWFIEAAMRLSRLTGLSETFVGLTIFAIGTSLPELAVNVTSSLRGLHELPVGNILGSNIANLLLVLGVAAIIRTIPVSRATVRIGLPLNLLAILLVGVLARERFGFLGEETGLSRYDGLLLMAGLPVYAFFSLSLMTRAKQQTHSVSKRQLVIAMLAIITSLAGLIVSAQWIVRGATVLASLFGLSEHLIGLSVVALGTSLPELATTVAGLLKKQHELVVGNLVGSNLLNVFLILGLSSVINPLPVSSAQFYDIGAVALATTLVWALVIRKHALVRAGGILCTISYFLYHIWRFSASSL